MMRLHGVAPYRTVLAHGGPGAAGSLKVCAEELHRTSGRGIAEALQSGYSIEELIGELYGQIREHCSGKIALVGHSWGAWLVALFAERYPELSEKIILVGCAPLEDKYVKDISERRKKNLGEADRAALQRFTEHSGAEDMRNILEILKKTDDYRPLEDEAPLADSAMYNSVWSEAAEARASGKLLSAFGRIKCKIIIIHGAEDPHPVDGVLLPLRNAGVPFEAHILDRCGHSPFREKYAKDIFYRILRDNIE